jgi:hypothetical protein
MQNTKINQRILIGVLLILLSIFCYAIHFVVFRDAHHIFIYLVGDIAFVFIEVLLVTLIIHQLLSEREKRAIMQKLNIVIGAFFTRIGTDLLKSFSAFDENNKNVAKHLVIKQNLSPEHFFQIRKVMENHDFDINTGAGDLRDLKKNLLEGSDFVLRLLENSNLLEHESFTELLWAVSHITEELAHRQNLGDLTEADRKHLAGDITRAHRLLMREWLSYMEHLKKEYPYLFSLAVRTNPFDPEASVELK